MFRHAPAQHLIGHKDKMESYDIVTVIQVATTVKTRLTISFDVFILREFSQNRRNYSMRN